MGGFVQAPISDTLPSPDELHYRNHARFNVWRESGALGFVHRERRRFVRIDRCLLMHDGINELISKLQGRCGETSQLSIRASQITGDHLVQPKMLNPDIPVESGQKRYREAVAGREFWVASPSFFQVNVKQAAQLAVLVKSALGLTGDETVLDAYAGVGAFAVLLAPDARQVIAVEESTAAVADALENAAGLANVQFLTGKVEDVLPNLDEIPDAVVLDPSPLRMPARGSGGVAPHRSPSHRLCILQPRISRQRFADAVPPVRHRIRPAGRYVSPDVPH